MNISKQLFLNFDSDIESYLYYLSALLSENTAILKLDDILFKLGNLALTTTYHKDKVEQLWRYVQLVFYQNLPKYHLLWPQFETIEEEAYFFTKKPFEITLNTSKKEQTLF